ncbi:ribosome maturation protein RimP [Pseudoblastomonas halimionae]|uniref:Ribosome maturation factor RimP n=1 Tax=Alteriqipengyuania halimionae TaxID=1926630 RepID=A0A6I4TZ04_9SPHN|nr:ribosome maturation protein RimP [Alteriqipengyuania halimionae]MXP08920.1 ribosome maturation protein RimP [Alteriqipengyuania halimionae]
MADLERLHDLIEPEAKALGFELVRVKMMPSEAGDGGHALQVMAEDPATGQLVIEQCAALSRRISTKLDELEADGDVLIEGHYHLEVSSPGIDRPLTRSKDYADWAGHEAKVSLSEKVHGHRNLRGKLVGIEGSTVTIADNKHGEIAVPLQNIHAAKLVLTDELIAATQPLDTSGADEIVEDTSNEEQD